VLKRPAAAQLRLAGRAKAAPAGQPVAAIAPQVLVPPPFDPPVALGVGDAATATGVSPELYAARTAALLRNADAMDRNSAALVAYAQAVGVPRSAGASAAPEPMPRAERLVTAAVTTASGATVESAALADVPCPLVLQPPRIALENALSRPGTIAAEVLLRDACLLPSSAVF
jgi:hypothetical protein